MSPSTCDAKPVFWQRQPRLPAPVMRFLKARVEEALADPAQRAHLVWPMILGAPAQRERFPEGLPEEHLLEEAGRMLLSVGITDPRLAWERAQKAFPDTADRGANGWVPHRIWEPLSALVSLRTGVTLLALLGEETGRRRQLQAGVSLFNCALFHEAHDALEMLWVEAQGDLKRGLQGLIMLTGGFHHQQHHNAPGMRALWGDAVRILEPHGSDLETPWGCLRFGPALDAAQARLDWLEREGDTVELEPLWDLARPEWRLR